MILGNWLYNYIKFCNFVSHFVGTGPVFPDDVSLPVLLNLSNVKRIALFILNTQLNQPYNFFSATRHSDAFDRVILVIFLCLIFSCCVLTLQCQNASREYFILFYSMF